jgi:hypothetical protein
MKGGKFMDDLFWGNLKQEDHWFSLIYTYLGDWGDSYADLD